MSGFSCFLAELFIYQLFQNPNCQRQLTCCLTSPAKLARSCRADHLQVVRPSLFTQGPMYELAPAFVSDLCGHLTSTHDQNILCTGERERLTYHMPHTHYVKGGIGSVKLGHLGCRYLYSTFYLPQDNIYFLQLQDRISIIFYIFI